MTATDETLAVPETPGGDSDDGAGAVRGRRAPEMTLLRPVPGDSPLHRSWAGTKLLAVAAVALGLSLRPSWAAIGVMAAAVFVAILIARIPRGAVPRLPRWFWLVLVIGSLLTLRSTRAPIVHLAGIPLSMGGLDEWGRYTALTTVVLAAAALVSWTTPLAEVAPALARLGRPLRWLRLPVDEWAATAALSIRCLPLLVEEIKTLAAVRRLRQQDGPAGEHRLARVVREAGDLLLASLTVSLRRARELADAIEARGGFGMVSDSHARAGWRDLVALVAMAGVMAALFVV